MISPWNRSALLQCTVDLPALPQRNVQPTQQARNDNPASMLKAEQCTMLCKQHTHFFNQLNCRPTMLCRMSLKSKGAGRDSNGAWSGSSATNAIGSDSSRSPFALGSDSSRSPFALHQRPPQPTVLFSPPLKVSSPCAATARVLA